MKEEKIIENFTQELKRGIITLNVLNELSEPEYGYSLASKLQEKGIEVEQNTLYPLLRRLEKQKLIESSWSLEGSRQRKYYSLNEKGKKVLEKLKLEWKKIVDSTNYLLDKESKSEFDW